MFLKSISVIIRLLIIAMVIILYIHYFFPQSWGFYTNEAKVPLYNLYAIHNGIPDKDPFLKNNVTYGMGISLKGRMLYGDLFNVINIKGLPWKPFIEDSLNYTEVHEKYHLITKATEYNSLKGKFLIIKTSRSFYLTLKNGERVHLSRQYILADIR